MGSVSQPYCTRTRVVLYLKVYFIFHRTGFLFQGNAARTKNSGEALTKFTSEKYAKTSLINFGRKIPERKQKSKRKKEQRYWFYWYLVTAVPIVSICFFTRSSQPLSPSHSKKSFEVEKAGLHFNSLHGQGDKSR